MEYWVLTQAGKEMIIPLQKEGREEEAMLLTLLDNTEGATVPQVSSAMRLDEKTAREKLKVMSGRRWVWQKAIKASPF